ncbi:MAG: AzlD domain-containing protein [Coriobacteriales bacterium]|nr:AzlD domain-containing protein [Coriobacteriales bacterium]MBQ6586504.1 AzlD domain-containing protein [Coriobacteriales bacterium]
MSWGTYLIIFAICVGTIVIFRVAPMFALADKELPDNVITMLNFIPVAAFAALVANDIFTPGAFQAGFWPAALPYVAAIPVIFCALKTRSLALCIVVGVAIYALLFYLV